MPAIPQSEFDLWRWKEGKKRRRILEGGWSEDIQYRICDLVDPSRKMSLGEPVASINLFKSYVEQISGLYENAPTPTIEDNEDAQQFLQAVFDEAHMGQVLAANCTSVVGLRESCIKIEWAAGVRAPRLRPVPTDSIIVQTDADDPYTILEVREARVREIGGDSDSYWDVWSIVDKANPYFRIEDGEGEDVTGLFMEPTAYPYIVDGVPFLPFVFYRASWTGKVWNSSALSELVNATLDLGVFWSMWGNVVLHSSWPQRYGIGVTIPGASVRGNGASRIGEISTSPSSIVMFESTGDGGGSLGQFSPGADPKALGEAITAFQATVLSNAGIHPADIEQKGPESGYAISLKRSAQRREALKMIPSFRAADTELLQKVLKIGSIFGGWGMEGLKPGIEYNIQKNTPMEDSAEFDLDMKKMEAGLISKVDLLRKMNPALTEEEALQRLEKNAAINSGSFGGVVIPAERVQELAALVRVKEQLQAEEKSE